MVCSSANGRVQGAVWRSSATRGVLWPDQEAAKPQWEVRGVTRDLANMRADISQVSIHRFPYSLAATLLLNSTCTIHLYHSRLARLPIFSSETLEDTVRRHDAGTLQSEQSFTYSRRAQQISHQYLDGRSIRNNSRRAHDEP